MTETKNAGSKRTPRSQAARGSKTTRQPWKPPQALEAPEAPPGMRYRWVRTHIRNEDDKTNVHKRFQEGYEPVHPSEVEGFDLPTIDELSSAGLIDNTNLDESIFGTGKFYKEKQEVKKENIYSNIDEMLSSTLKNDDD